MKAMLGWAWAMALRVAMGIVYHAQQEGGNVVEASGGRGASVYDFNPLLMGLPGPLAPVFGSNVRFEVPSSLVFQNPL